MQSFENTQTAPGKRLGVNLNVDTGYKGKEKEISQPETPKRENGRHLGKANIAVANRALKVRTGPRETFLDDITPIDPSNRYQLRKQYGLAQEPEHRDSHDLSEVTRDSLVDHMLLSLDSISQAQGGDGFGRQPTADEDQLYSTFDDDPYVTTSSFAPRSRGHNYNYSSDYENAEPSSQSSGRQRSGSRRSNSSSNFQNGLQKMASFKNDVGGGTFGALRGQPPQVPHRMSHSRGGKGSKGSSANSYDLGYAQNSGGAPWGSGLTGRSSSFDSGSDRHAINTETTHQFQMEQSLPSFDAYDDAAPTPTVPAGPRRQRPISPIMARQIDQITPPKLERKRSTRSSKSAYKGKLASNGSGGRFDDHERPPMPVYNNREAAPAPLVGYGKAKAPEQPNPGTAQAPKEKPGFFRRVFGSSKNHSIPPVPQTSHGTTRSADSADRPESRPQHIGGQLKSQQATPTREPPPPPKETTHVLTKKPSSFFRRRKKSISEVEIPVPVPVIPQTLLTTEPTSVLESLPSPVSSLRQVMNPYIHSPARSPIDTYHHGGLDAQLGRAEEVIERPRDFSPDYEPDPSATIRKVLPKDRPVLKNLPSPMMNIPGTFLDSPDERDATFLQDKSDNEPSDFAVKETLSTSWLPDTPQPSPSMTKDMSHLPRKSTPLSAKNDIPSSPPSSSKKASLAARKGEEWVMLTPTKGANGVDEENRVYLEPSSSDEEVIASRPEPNPRSSGSVATIYQSATSLPLVQIDEPESPRRSPKRIPSRPFVTAAEAVRALDSQAVAEVSPVAMRSEKEQAQKIYDGNEDFVDKEKAAAWLGEEDAVRSRVLDAYMALYDFANLNILASLRALCSRLVVKGESQQVDRILVTFSKRWCECNPNHGFKSVDVIHTICYSLLLLNTDLHLADIEQKMTRSQFVKNAMPTVRKSVADSVPEALEQSRPSILPGKGSTFDVDSIKQSSLATEGASIEIERPSWRSSFRPPPRMERTESDSSIPTPLDYDTPIDDCGPLVKSQFNGTLRTWEVQVEIVLKDFYNSISKQRLPLFGAPYEKPSLQAPSSNSLSIFANGMLRRTPSVLSKTPSEAYSNRGRGAETVRVGNGKWANKNRSRPRLYPGSGMGSSRTSLDDQSSMWSPSVSSSTWSKYSLGKTHTSMSVDSLGSSWPQGDYQQSIGFANALSQAIIREETTGSPGSPGSDRDEPRIAPLLEDESLELAGAPWAKEGIVKHKHHLESLDKKAKDRNWNEVFAVIEKGYMSLFSFTTKSMRKTKGKHVGVVGGGNWQDNAQSLGSFLLRQTIASALPSPGYSKARPHVWALSLPTGAVHLFQVGTPDIVKEFVSTANYWSARLSNHPLVGGISNIEYGWSDAIVNNSLVTAINDSQGVGPGHRPSTSLGQSSLHGSLRSSFDQAYGRGDGMRPKLAADKIHISDWTPPTQSMRASNLMEEDQLRTLTDYVSGIEEELQKHNQLRSPMSLAVSH